MPTGLLPQPVRLIGSSDLRCPAADTALGGHGVRCGIERHTLVAADEPRSVERFCCGNYSACSTWRAHKEAVWEQKAKELDAEIDAEIS